MNWILMKYPNGVHRELDSKIKRLHFHLFIVMHIVTIIIFNNLLLIHTKYILSIDNTQILKHWDHHVWKKTKARRRRWEESSVKLLAPKCIYPCALIKKLEISLSFENTKERLWTKTKIDPTSNEFWISLVCI